MKEGSLMTRVQSADAAPNTAAEPAPDALRTAAGKDVERLHALLKDDGDARGGRKGDDEPSRNAKALERDAEAESIQAALLAMVSGTAVPDSGAAQPSAAPAPVRDIDSLVEATVKTMLVGERPDGTQEVRLHIKETTLADTNIVLSREDGVLQVRFESGRDDDLHLLAGNAEALSAQLTKRLGEAVAVAVVPAGGSGASDGQTGQGRSKGYEDILRYAEAERR